MEPKQPIGNPLTEAAQTGMLGQRRPLGVKPTGPLQSSVIEQKVSSDVQPGRTGKDEKPERIKGTILFTPERKIWLKVRAAQKNVEMSDIVEEALALWEKMNP
jgi:hypothetical protein